MAVHGAGQRSALHKPVTSMSITEPALHWLQPPVLKHLPVAQLLSQAWQLATPREK